MATPLFSSSFHLPPATVDPTLPALCASDLPLVLLPVRLETRFFTVGAATELRVRVYPDKIHLDAHERDLLPDENEWGMHYWDQDWRAGNDDTARADAWRQLADHVGPERAAWIARSLRPTNAAARYDGAPIAPGQPLPTAIAFPPVALVPNGVTSPWRSAPQARLLPDRWIVVVQSGTARIQVVGNAIARPLYVGPDPLLSVGSIPADQLAIDPAMSWMVDFAAAEAKGMAMRVTVPAAMLTTGIETVLVFGVAASLDGPTAARQLGDLLDAHHYTDGLEFLRFGTPTNNTDDRRAAATRDDAAHTRSFDVECQSDPAALPAPSNAVRVGAALGLPTGSASEVLGRIGQADDQHELDMRSMNAALWQVGWGYYLPNMIGFQGTGLTRPLIDWARCHFVSYVRAGGPFPVLRCGRQPYGILPATSLDLWKPQAGDPAAAQDAWLNTLLKRFRDNMWRPRLTEAFRLGRRETSTTPNLDADLVDVMRTDGISSHYVTRNVFGRHFLQHLRAFLGEDLAATGFIPTQDATAIGFVQRMGFPWRPRIAGTIGADAAWPITVPMVQGGEVSPWVGLTPNYIADLLGQPTIQAVLAWPPPPAARPLLAMLLRHALLRELADAAARIAAGPPPDDYAGQVRDAELIDLVTGGPSTRTWKRVLASPMPGVAGQTIGQHLEGLQSYVGLDVAALGDFRGSLAHLQGLDSERIEHLMRGTLDLSSHRLDAWITSFATKRLAAMRSARLTGVYVGAYGWVENLRATPASAVRPVPAPAGEAGPIVAPTNDPGFIHAPSATHAAAAALLRNAHLGVDAAPTATSPFAIELSSHRVREAERLLDGVRQGQPLGALLGYRLERGLHEVGGLDAAIYTLRRLAPLTARPLPNSAAPTDAIAPNNVVDGLALFHIWSTSQQTVIDALAVDGIGAAASAKVQQELAVFGDVVDGLSDALTAEVAYQAARGNPSRLSATLAAIAQGDASPPELEVARMPRTGTTVTHRVLMLVSGTANLGTPGWLNWDAGVRSAIDRVLTFWVGKLLGDGSKVRCTIERLDDATGAVVETVRFPLQDMAISALDALYAVEADTGDMQDASLPTVLEQLVLYHAKHRTGGFAPDATLRLQHARPTDLAIGEITLVDLIEVARDVRRHLASVRAADPEDVNPPERTTGATIDVVELESRTLRAENVLNAAHKQLATIVAKPTTATAEQVRTLLVRLVGYGIPQAVPCSAAGEDPAAHDALIAQARTVLKTSGPRLDRCIALRTTPAAADPRARCGQLAERLRAAFGQAFLAMPHFTLEPAAATELGGALAASTQTLGGDALAANGWLTRGARVRDGIARLAACTRNADVLGAAGRLSLTVAQLPFQGVERWVGLPPLAGAALPPGKLSLVVQMINTFVATQPLTGLLIDEWTEVVPNVEENTALTFQFTPPDACAPQNVLVAVPPDPAAPWTSDTLGRVLAETLDLAKLRAIDPESVGETAQYLPALYLAFNEKDDAVSTNFAALTT